MNLKRVLLLLALICCGPVLQAQDAKETILFTNVKVFNGVDETLLDADVLVEGNPLEDLDLVADAEKNFVVIMKDGKVYKNQL